MIDPCTLIQLEGTTHCNAKCKFCPVGFLPLERPSGEMREELFRKIVAEGMQMGVEDFLIFLNGEPLMDRRFFPWLDYLAERDLHSTLFTNGSLLTRPKADKLATYQGVLRHITFSFHGGNAETYHHVMGLNFEKTRANVEYFLSINQDRIPTQVYLLKYEDTEASEPAFRALWGQRAFVSEAYFNWAGLTESQRNKALQLPPQPCQRLLHHMVILASGQVALCCLDYQGAVNWGDANIDHLSTIWERAQPWRDRHKALDFSMPLCSQCNLNRFGG